MKIMICEIIIRQHITRVCPHWMQIVPAVPVDRFVNKSLLSAAIFMKNPYLQEQFYTCTFWYLIRA
jgi:hypothetical protein